MEKQRDFLEPFLVPYVVYSVTPCFLIPVSTPTPLLSRTCPTCDVTTETPLGSETSGTRPSRLLSALYVSVCVCG